MSACVKIHIMSQRKVGLEPPGAPEPRKAGDFRRLAVRETKAPGSWIDARGSWNLIKSLTFFKFLSYTDLSLSQFFVIHRARFRWRTCLWIRMEAYIY